MTMTPEAPERYSPPYINFQRATVAFDDCCRALHDYFSDIKDACLIHDLTPELEQLQAMMTEVVNWYVGVNREQDASAAVAMIVDVIACPLDGWSES